jgi:hypothetical protein
MVRILLGGLFAVCFGWLSIAVSGASLLRYRFPEAALKLQPWDARASAGAASQILTATQGRVTPEVVRRATDLARQALERDPTVVEAWRTLAILSTRPRQAQALFYFANSLSRRDVPTQLWLIEESVRRNDIPGALGHYDAALRSSLASQQILIPVLVGATGERRIVPPLAALLRTRPPWRMAFLNALVAGAPNPDNLVQLLMMLGRPASPEEAQLMVGSIDRLAEQNAFGPALRLYQMLAGRSPAGQLLRNGGFDRPNVYPPLDWELADGADINVEQRPAPGSGQGQSLYIRASTDARGQAARQLIFLAPGSYALSALSGRTDLPGPEGLSWQISCASAPNSPLLDQPAVPAGPAARTIRGEFRVPPSGCAAQWLTLQIVSGDQPGGTEAWVASVRIDPANRSG